MTNHGDPLPEADLDGALMALALDEARAALAADEVPIGAVVVRDGVVLGRGRNRCRAQRDSTAHAELEALRQAFAMTGDMRLPGAAVYTTVEPCFMCAGALSHARIARVVWAVRDPKFGGAVSLGSVLTDPRANHRATVHEGVGADEARALLQGFFRAKRALLRAAPGQAARAADDGADADGAVEPGAQRDPDEHSEHGEHDEQTETR